MLNMLAREALLLALPKTKFTQVKSLRLSYEIWTTLQSTFEGDNHAQRLDYKIRYAYIKMLK